MELAYLSNSIIFPLDFWPALSDLAFASKIIVIFALGHQICRNAGNKRAQPNLDGGINNFKICHNLTRKFDSRYLIDFQESRL